MNDAEQSVQDESKKLRNRFRGNLDEDDDVDDDDEETKTPKSCKNKNSSSVTSGGR